MDKNTPIIIKRIKKGGHGHHGGAWKVAYADFVTAMMAFFLLLWLVSVSTQEQRSGLADYFTPTQGMKDAVGVGQKGGMTITTEGERKDNKSNPAVQVGGMPAGSAPEVSDKKSLIESAADANLFENAMDKMKKNIESDPDLATFKENIDAKITPDGLKIDVTDSDKYSMFETNAAKLTGFGETVLKKMGDMVKTLPNHVTITGHTDAGKVEKANGYTNWDLSSDRANAARKFLSPQLEAERITRVIGAADKDLLLPSAPTSSKNRRITILLLRGSYMDGQGGGESIRETLTVPKPVDTSKLGTNAKKPAAATPPAPAPAPAPGTPHAAPAAPTAAPAAPPAPAEPAPAPAPVTAPVAPAGPVTGRVSSLPGMSAAGASGGDE